MGGEGGAVVSEGRVAEAVGTEFKLTSDGEEEEPGLPRDTAVRGGVGSTDATPTGPGSRGAAAWVRAEREAEDAGETKGPVREGVVEVTAPVVVTETERVVVGVAAVGGVVALSRGDWAARNDEPGVTAAPARDGEGDDDVVKAAVDWMIVGAAEGVGSADLGAVLDGAPWADPGRDRVGEAEVCAVVPGRAEAADDVTGVEDADCDVDCVEEEGCVVGVDCVEEDDRVVGVDCVEEDDRVVGVDCVEEDDRVVGVDCVEEGCVVGVGCVDEEDRVEEGCVVGVDCVEGVTCVDEEDRVEGVDCVEGAADAVLGRTGDGDEGVAMTESLARPCAEPGRAEIAEVVVVCAPLVRARVGDAEPGLVGVVVAVVTARIGCDPVDTEVVSAEPDLEEREGLPWPADPTAALAELGRVAWAGEASDIVEVVVSSDEGSAEPGAV